jgi:hypothetical protein
MWLYELRYQAEAWDKPRRVVLMVKEREGDLLLDRFPRDLAQLDGKAAP